MLSDRCYEKETKHERQHEQTEGVNMVCYFRFSSISILLHSLRASFRPRQGEACSSSVPKVAHGQPTSSWRGWPRASQGPRRGRRPLWHSMPGYTIAGGAGRAGPTCPSSLPLTWRWGGPTERGVTWKRRVRGWEQRETRATCACMRPPGHYVDVDEIRTR